MRKFSPAYSFFLIFIVFFIILFSILSLDSTWAEKSNIHSHSVSLINSQGHYLGNWQKINSQEIIFSKIKAKDEFNTFGFKWKVEGNKNYKIMVKVNNYDWQEIKPMEEANKNKTDFIYSEPIFQGGNNINVKVISNRKTRLADLELIYFDSRLFSSAYSLKRTTTASDEQIKIISRAEWGADESLRFWEPQYAEPKAFVIHHTAGGDGGDDPVATVRGIYYWHAIILGWGDIGYNYLIDKNGNIYEGRYGGDKVIGAHTYNSSEDVNYNEGTAGIAVLGCFEDEEEGCESISEYNSDINSALVDFVANKAYKLNIDLSGQRQLFQRKINSVVGHQDLDQTLCPGNIIEDKLSAIRKEAINELDNLLVNQTYQANLISNNFVPAYFVNSKNDIKITYENSGSLPWEAQETRFQLYNKKTKEKINTVLIADAGSGDTSNFNFIWQPKKLGEQTLVCKLYRDNKIIPHSRSLIKVRIDSMHQAKLVSHNLPIAVLADWNPVINFSYQNIGQTSWSNQNTKLYVNGKSITPLKEKKINYSETGNFEFTLQDIENLKKGQNSLKIIIKNNNEIVQYSRLLWTLRVD